MYGKIRADNFFYTTLASEINATDKVGTFELTSKTVNGYTVEDGSYMFWMIVGLNDPATAEVFRITNVAGTVLTYDKRISPTGMAIHAVGSLVNMQASSDFINWLSNNTNDLGYTETVDGAGNELKVKTYGGRIENPSAADIVVADTTLTLIASSTNYIYFDDSDNAIKSSITEPETYKVFANVVTGASAVTSIEDYRAEKIIMGAVPLSLTATDIAGLTNVRPGTVVYNETTGENQQYIGGDWFPIAAGSTQPRATETTEGKVRIATDVEYAAGTEVGVDGATLVPTPGQTNSTATTTIKGVARLATQEEVIAMKEPNIIVSPSTLGWISGSKGVLGEAMTAGSLKGAVFYGYSQQSESNIGTVSYDFGKYSYNTIQISRVLSSGIIEEIVINPFVAVGNPGTISVNLLGITNSNKTLTISQAQAIAGFDIGQLYLLEYGEYIYGAVGNTIYIVLSQTTVDGINYYITNNTSINGDVAITNGTSSGNPEGWQNVTGTTITDSRNGYNFKNFSGLFKTSDGGYGDRIRITINGVAVSSEYTLTTSFVQFNGNVNQKLNTGDVIAVQRYRASGSGLTLTWNSLSRTIEGHKNTYTLKDGFSSDKLYKTDIRIPYSNICHGIILEGGNKNDLVFMAELGKIVDLGASINSTYWLNNSTGATRGEYTTNKPGNSRLIGACYKTGEIVLMIQYQNGILRNV